MDLRRSSGVESLTFSRLADILLTIPECKKTPIEVQFNILRALVHRAIEIGIMEASKNPFLVFKYKGVKTSKEKLDDDKSILQSMPHMSRRPIKTA